MLNPSTADDIRDDATIRRCISFARTWGYGALEVVNLFAYRATHPKELRHVADPVGQENDLYLLRVQSRVETIVVAWGNWGRFQQRNKTVLNLLADRSVIYCLGLTRLGHPRHPLYVRADTALIRFPSYLLKLAT